MGLSFWHCQSSFNKLWFILQPLLILIRNHELPAVLLLQVQMFYVIQVESNSLMKLKPTFELQYVFFFHYQNLRCSLLIPLSSACSKQILLTKIMIFQPRKEADRVILPALVSLKKFHSQSKEFLFQHSTFQKFS